MILISAVLLMPLETASGTANAAQAADIADTAGAAGEIAQSYEIQQLIGLVFPVWLFWGGVVTGGDAAVLMDI